MLRYMAKYRNDLDYLVNVLKALSDAGRIRIVMALAAAGELCVCQVVELLGLAPSTVSKHLSILKQAGLIKSRKKGRWVYYSFTDSGEGVVIRDYLRDSLLNDETVLRDSEVVKKFLCEDIEVLCQRKLEN